MASEPAASEELTCTDPASRSDASPSASRFLKKYGYDASDATSWRAPTGAAAWPQLEVAVECHYEQEGHTLYEVRCSLRALGLQRPLAWRAAKRLEAMRRELHDAVKAGLDREVYSRTFRSAPFALRGGPPGTTARLNGWLGALAGGANAGEVPPALLAQILVSLEVPEPPSAIGAAVGAAGSLVGRVRGALATAKEAVSERAEQTQAQAAAAAVGFARANPKAAQAALGYASKNPQAAKAVGGTAFSMAKDNPQLLLKGAGGALKLGTLAAKAAR